MARHTDITCDECGYTDGPDGGTEWIAVKKGKRRLDFEALSCLSAWVAKQSRQAEMAGVR